MAMFITDTQAAVGRGTQLERLQVHAPFVDVGLRLFQPLVPSVQLMTLAVRSAFLNPFLKANDILNRFNLSLAARPWFK